MCQQDDYRCNCQDEIHPDDAVVGIGLWSASCRAPLTIRNTDDNAAGCLRRIWSWWWRKADLVSHSLSSHRPHGTYGSFQFNGMRIQTCVLRDAVGERGYPKSLANDAPVLTADGPRLNKTMLNSIVRLHSKAQRTFRYSHRHKKKWPANCDNKRSLNQHHLAAQPVRSHFA